MCDFNHLPKTINSENKMPPLALVSSKSSENWASSNIRDVRPSPEVPDPVMAAATPLQKPLKSSSGQPNCVARFQLSSSELSFEDVEDVPNWKSCRREDSGIKANSVDAESTRDFEQLPLGDENEERPRTGSSEEGSLQLSISKTPNASGSEFSTNFEGRSCASGSASTQRYASQGGMGTTAIVEDFKEGLTCLNNPRSCVHRSETEIDADAREAGAFASAETEPRLSRRCCETPSRFEACVEPETGFNKTSETRNGVSENETDFDKHSRKPVFVSEPDASRKATAHSKFDASAIETVTHQLLQRILGCVTYDPQRCRILSHSLAGQILAGTIELIPNQYKLVVFVSIGSLTDNPGIQFGSRCLWDADTDELATVRYANESLFAVVMVYGLYRD